MTTTMTKKGLSGFHLKYIALLAMTIDHTGAVLMPASSPVYTIFRAIGRIAFPLYCFLLVEGYFHTSNHRAYFTRLLLFAFLSELPFDMALYHFPSVNDFSILSGHQNVYFTLAFGFLSMCLMDRFWHQRRETALLCALFSCICAEALNFDYGATGIFVILIFYAYRRFYTDRNPYQGYLVGILPLLAYKNPFVYAAFPLMVFYNGKKGNALPGNRTFPYAKYFFYLYYPVHLMILAAICQ